MFFLSRGVSDGEGILRKDITCLPRVSDKSFRICFRRQLHFFQADMFRKNISSEAIRILFCLASKALTWTRRKWTLLHFSPASSFRMYLRCLLCLAKVVTSHQRQTYFITVGFRNTTSCLKRPRCAGLAQRANGKSVLSYASGKNIARRADTSCQFWLLLGYCGWNIVLID